MQITCGKDKGKQGEIVKVLRRDQNLLIGGLNLVRPPTAPAPPPWGSQPAPVHKRHLPAGDSSSASVGLAGCSQVDVLGFLDNWVKFGAKTCLVSHRMTGGAARPPDESDARLQVKKHLPAQGSQPGSIITKPSPIALSNVALLDPTTGRALLLLYSRYRS